MASPYQLPVTAAQVGSYFVGQYYQVLQQQPEFVHQFYSDTSTMLRIDGNNQDSAVSMMQIHSLTTSLSYSSIEIKSANSLASMNGGVFVMVSGSVQLKGYDDRRKFVQSFFLAPQEKGFFVLNDIFSFVDDEDNVQHAPVYLTQSNLDSQVNASTAFHDQVPTYAFEGEIQGRDYVVEATVEENRHIDNYNYSDEMLQTVPNDDHFLEDNFASQSNGPIQSVVNPVQDHSPLADEEPIGEPQKLTYASIVAKKQAPQTVAHSVNKVSPPSSEWNHAPEPPIQPSVVSSNAFERSGADHFEESAFEDEDEPKSVYVKNVPTTMAPSEIEEEFKKFGKIKRDGVAIRTRKDIDICYAFVEYEDLTGVHNAIKASSVHISGHPLYIEGRRPNRGMPIRGRGRGRGRMSYQNDGARGRFGGRGYGSRGNGQDSNDYNRPRANGYYKQGQRGYSNSQQGFSD